MRIGYSETPLLDFLGDSLHPGLANVHGMGNDDVFSVVEQCHRVLASCVGGQRGYTAGQKQSLRTI